MLEEVTPEIVGLSLFLITLVTPVFTLVLSALLLWGYRRAVARAVAPSAFYASVPALATAHPAAARRRRPDRLRPLPGSDSGTAELCTSLHHCRSRVRDGLCACSAVCLSDPGRSARRLGGRVDLCLAHCAGTAADHSGPDAM